MAGVPVVDPATEFLTWVQLLAAVPGVVRVELTFKEACDSVDALIALSTSAPPIPLPDSETGLDKAYNVKV
jgi:hypothetical protein